MHEAGIAHSVLGVLRGREQEWCSVRLLVRGGHSAPDSFDPALRAHIAAGAPDFDLDSLEIVHLPVERTCSACGWRYDAVDPTALCPACGGSPWPTATAEQIELELLP